MIDIQKLTQTVEDAIREPRLFIVSIDVDKENNITVTLDSPEGLDIDTCVRITRTIEEAFDRDKEDYELTVTSAGLTAPFTVPQQYEMNVGNEVEVLTADRRKLRGTLAEVSDGCKEITVSVPTKVKEPGMKRPEIRDVATVIPVADIKTITRHIDF